MMHLTVTPAGTVAADRPGLAGHVGQWDTWAADLAEFIRAGGEAASAIISSLEGEPGVQPGLYYASQAPTAAPAPTAGGMMPLLLLGGALLGIVLLSR